MDKFYFGADVGIYGNLENVADEIKKYGGNLIQIFLTPPGSTTPLEKTKEIFINFKKYLEKNDMKVVVHSSYIHNLANPWDEYSWWLKNLEIEIKYAHMIGAIGIVLHFGKRKELSIQEAYNNMYTSLIHVLNNTKKYKDIKIFLETPTGQGSEICYKLEDLAYFYKKFSKSENPELKNRVGLCVDTCHIFAAGYDLKTKTQIQLYLEAFEELIGIRHIHLIHLNDCKGDVGCMKDRHMPIGKGYIGYDGLKYIFDYFKNLNVPIILETPGYNYRNEIKLLK